MMHPQDHDCHRLYFPSPPSSSRCPLWVVAMADKQRFVFESIKRLPERKEDAAPSLDHPVLFNYSHGQTPPGGEKPDLKLFADPSTPGAKLLTCTASGIDWEGREGTDLQNVKYYVGIRSKKAGTMRLVELDSHYALRPRILRPADSDESGSEAEETPAASAKKKRRQSLSNVEAREQVMSMFGGARTQSRYESARRNQYRQGMVAEDYAKDLVKAAEKQKEEDGDALGGTHLTTRHLAPPHDIDATEASEAYPLEGMMTPHEWETIKSQADDLIYRFGKKAFAAIQHGWDPVAWKFLLHVLSSVGVDASTTQTRTMAALYLNILIKLTTSGGRKYTEASKQRLQSSLGIDEEHVSVLLETFAEKAADADGGSVFQKGQTSDDKLRCFAIVAWLTIFGFVHCRHIGELARALGVTSKDVAIHATRLGGKLHRKKGAERSYDAFTVTLNVPLVFPALAKSKKRKRRPSRG